MIDRLTLTWFSNQSDRVWSFITNPISTGFNRQCISKLAFIALVLVVIYPEYCRAAQNHSYLAAVYSLLLRTESPETPPCTILLNPGFEQGTEDWLVTGEYSLVSDAYMGSRAIMISDGDLDQTSLLLSVIADTYPDTYPDTYQFSGYYKTMGLVDDSYAGMIFYDENWNLLLSKMLYLNESDDYSKFVLNATATSDVQYIRVWVSSTATESTGDIILDHLQLSPSSCYDYQVASALPPGGFSANQVPQFVIMAFDDNTKSDGINWAIDLFANKYNHDESEVTASFYMNTTGLYEWVEDDPDILVTAMQLLESTNHEIGNHTDNHHKNLHTGDDEELFRSIRELDYSPWQDRIMAANSDLVEIVGVATSDIKGFRAPYLYYTQNSMSVINANNFLYDCSIEEGYASEFDGTNFRWPYQLNGGSPGHSESWHGSSWNNERVDLPGTDELWSLPNYALMVPDNDESATYGIERGLWERLKANIPYLDDYKITGLDYNLLHLGEINKAEFLGILKYNLDLRMTGNRAPLMVSAHTQYYTGTWAEDNAPNITMEEMREVLSEFVDYALTHEEVRIKKGVDVIEWCNNPPLP